MLLSRFLLLQSVFRKSTQPPREKRQQTTGNSSSSSTRGNENFRIAAKTAPSVCLDKGRPRQRLTRLSFSRQTHFHISLSHPRGFPRARRFWRANALTLLALSPTKHARKMNVSSSVTRFAVCSCYFGKCFVQVKSFRPLLKAVSLNVSNNKTHPDVYSFAT